MEVKNDTYSKNLAFKYIFVAAQARKLVHEKNSYKIEAVFVFYSIAAQERKLVYEKSI